MDYTTSSILSGHLSEYHQNSQPLWMESIAAGTEAAESSPPSTAGANTLASLAVESSANSSPTADPTFEVTAMQEADYAPLDYVEYGMEEKEWDKLKAKFTREGREQQLKKRFPCMACSLYNEKELICQLSCGHAYCRRCLCKMVFFILLKQVPYPVKCCRPLKLHEISEWLDNDIYRRYLEITVEIETARKIYCANKKCSTFIREKFIQCGIGTCQECGFQTCQSCKQALNLHTTKDVCPPNTEDDLVLTMANHKKWKRCKCGQLVEKEGGCNAMICETCGTEFCYRCGALLHKCVCHDQPSDDGLSEGESSEEEESIEDRLDQDDATLQPGQHDLDKNSKQPNPTGIEYGREIADMSNVSERSDVSNDQGHASNLPSVHNIAPDTNDTETHPEVDNGVEEPDSSEGSAPSNNDQGDSSEHETLSEPSEQNIRWWDHGHDPRDLLPRTAEESDKSNYVYSSIWYLVPQYDRQLRRRLTPDEMDEEYHERLEQEIANVWVHVPGRAEIEQEQQREWERERDRVKLRPRSVRAKMQRSSKR